MTIAVAQADLDLLGQPVSLDGDSLIVRTTVRGVPVKVSIQISAAIDGSLELGIVKATAAGLGWFGIVRKQAGDVLMQRLAPLGTVWKVAGNIRYSPGFRWHFAAAQIANSKLTLSLRAQP